MSSRIWGFILALCVICITNSLQHDSHRACAVAGETPAAIPGKFVISIRQEIGDRDAFAMSENRLITRLGAQAEERFQNFQMLRAGKKFHRHNMALYSLTFAQSGRDAEILAYLRSLPRVLCAQQDYYINFLAEPNDLHYLPDSTNLLAHWVPDSMNCLLNNRGLARTCVPMFTCCPSADVQIVTFTYKDALHLSDQWYLQHIQANKAWDITTGSPEVKIMIMDSGIDIDHPDLAGNIWDNSLADPAGDANQDGLPGGAGDDDNDGGRNFNDPQIGTSDINDNDVILWGFDGICDAGPDGDYGFGPDGVDNPPAGPGGGDDAVDDPLGDPWDDNIKAPGYWDDDLEDVQFMKRDDDENGYPDDFCGFNFYDAVSDWHRDGEVSDGLPGLKNEDIDNDGLRNYNDFDVGHADFDGDGKILWGDDNTCDAGPDGDYGFGADGVDNPPPGPGGGDDALHDPIGEDPWDDNLKSPGNWDDDLDDVQFLRFDDEEDGEPFSLPIDDSCPKAYACHGTGMAGIVGAVTNNGIGIAGVAWNCKLVSAKIAIGVPESGKSGSVIPIARAIYYAVDKKVDIINMSFGDEWSTYDHPIINQAIEYAYARGIIMVAGAGNTYAQLDFYPASHPRVISASGCNRKDEEAQCTTYGPKVDVCGLVVDIGREGPSCACIDPWGYPTACPERGADCMTTAYYRFPACLHDWDNQVPHGYATTYLQTSGATAEVSGLAALLVSLYPKSWYLETHPQEVDTHYVNWITDQIKRGCEPISGPHANMLGAGRINAYRSLTQWGYIAENTTWSNAVYVSADIKVGAGVTLTIEPGTTIYIATDDNENIGTDSAKVAIDVFGTLIANGTPENPITFRSLSDDPEPGDWYGIFFKGEYSSGSLSHCNIRDAKYGVVSYATVEIEHCEISNCKIAGIYMTDHWDTACVVNNESVIRHCTITENWYPEASGMLIWNCPLEITVDSCTVNMNYRGIWASNSRLMISGSEIACNAEDGIWVTSYRYPQPYPYPTIHRCRIFLNGESGIHCLYNKAQVSYTRSWQNFSYGLLAYGVDAYPEIDHSKIINNASAGVRAEVGGKPVLGIVSLGQGQNNSLYGQPKNVYNATGVTLYAENCWWGAAPPDKTKMYGPVDYTPYLTSDPVPYLAPEAPRTPPAVFALEQNYPNPFGLASGTTSIRYSLPPSREQAELKIYDVSGRLVRTLVEDARAGDEYIAMWDGKNDRGARVAAGIYFYKLRLGQKSMTKKMVLFR